MGIPTSKSSALSMSVLLIFEMQETNGALFLKAKVYLFGIITPL